MGSIAVVALLAFAPSAQAAFSISGLSATPASTDAGANTNVSIGLDTPDDATDIRDLTIHLPPGLIGNPQAAPQCTEAELAADSCNPASDVGDVSNDITATVLGFIPVPLTVNGNLYNVVPRAGEPARFGIVLNPLPFNVPVLGPALFPKIILQSAASLRPSDLGLDTVLNDLPNTATVAGIATDVHIDSVSLTLSGMAGNPPQGFIRLPTSCGTHTVGFDARSYDAQTAAGQTTFDTFNCAALPFTPELTARIKQGAVAEAVELTTTISQTIDEAGLRTAQVTLPADLSGNASILATTCSDADFQAGNCPPNTIVGSAVAASALLAAPLSGPVALVTPATPGLPDLGIDLRGPLALKLKGKIALAGARNQVTFDGLPDIPIDAFALTFAGGPTGLNLPARDLCKPPPVVFDSSYVAHSGATATSTPTATVTCSGGGSGNGGGNGHNGDKKPRARIHVGRLGSDKPTLKLAVKAGAKKLRAVKVKLPSALRATHGRQFAHNASAGGKVKLAAKKRKLSLKTRKPLGSIHAKLKPGALRAGKGLGRHAKLRFRVAVRDASGKTTKLTVRAK